MGFIINASHLSKRYIRPEGHVDALDYVSLTVNEGEFVVIRGPSGCGKTTLLLILGGLLAPDGGELAVCNQNPYAMGPNERAAFRAASIGFVFQQFHLVPYLSVRDNVLAAAMARPSDDAGKRADELIARFGLGGRGHHLPSQLSTGERQRTALARAMLNDPRLILADEPTGNLDARNGHEVLTSLAELADGRRSVVVVTHDVAVESFAHRTINLESGRLTNLATGESGEPGGDSGNSGDSNPTKAVAEGTA